MISPPCELLRAWLRRTSVCSSIAKPRVRSLCYSRYHYSVRHGRFLARQRFMSKDFVLTPLPHAPPHRQITGRSSEAGSAIDQEALHSAGLSWVQKCQVRLFAAISTVNTKDAAKQALFGALDRGSKAASRHRIERPAGAGSQRQTAPLSELASPAVPYWPLSREMASLASITVRLRLKSGESENPLRSRLPSVCSLYTCCQLHQ